MISNFCLSLIKEGLGFWNAKVKGIANLTKVQVPLHLTGRVSSIGPSQYHQTFALATVRADLLLISSRIGLYCTQTLALSSTYRGKQQS
jgi:hypothetical protein